MNRIWVLGTAAILLSQSVAGVAQTGTPVHEQVEFSMETDIVPIEHPLVPPEPLMQVLTKDPLVAKVVRPCMKSADSPVEIPASWFVASEIRLAGPDEDDFVILPKNQCMNGVNVGPFWLVKKVHDDYQVILSTGGHDLNVLPHRHNGHRDVEVLSATASEEFRVIFSFDGKSYQKVSVQTH